MKDNKGAGVIGALCAKRKVYEYDVREAARRSICRALKATGKALVKLVSCASMYSRAL